jgi:hypothetical protein
MAILRLDRFTVNPADTADLLARHAELVTAARDAFAGLIDVQLARVDDRTWIDVWRWDTLASAQAAVASAPGIPQARAAFALAKDLTVEYAEVVDA